MSARRKARARTGIALDTTGGVPRCLSVGRCIEVWATEPTNPRCVPTIGDARRRFDQVRRWWLDAAGISTKDGWSVIGGGAPWSAAYMEATGRAEDVEARLAQSGCKPEHLPVIRAEAADLHRRAVLAATDDRRIFKESA